MEVDEARAEHAEVKVVEVSFRSTTNISLNFETSKALNADRVNQVNKLITIESDDEDLPVEVDESFHSSQIDEDYEKFAQMMMNEQIMISTRGSTYQKSDIPPINLDFVNSITGFVTGTSPRDTSPKG
jgi:hypothetical protein